MDMEKLGGVGNMDRTALPDNPDGMIEVEAEDASGLAGVGSPGAGTSGDPNSGTTDQAEANTEEEASGQLSAGGAGYFNPVDNGQNSPQESELVENGAGLSGTENTTGADEQDLAG